MICMDERLQKKLHKSLLKSIYNKRYYWKIRLATIKFLGGECSECGETDVSKLEIHHKEPTLNGGYKGTPGSVKLNEWKRIIAGEIEAILYCHECHIKVGHNGSTYGLRKDKDSKV